ncbi:hypothetical protein D3C86_1742340 [compost metagenome]
MKRLTKSSFLSSFDPTFAVQTDVDFAGGRSVACGVRRVILDAPLVMIGQLHELYQWQKVSRR